MPDSRPQEPARRFVVQLHRARRAHYDFRLELDGVLVSWAVPKGPSLDPKVRRAAFHVEDHPVEYVDFEGIIPAGTYGGGDVIVWDAGTWVPYKDPDPAAAVAAGELHFELHGRKLRGRFVIVRTRADEWLLMHKRDEHAVGRVGRGRAALVGPQWTVQRRGAGRPGADVALGPAGGPGGGAAQGEGADRRRARAAGGARGVGDVARLRAGPARHEPAQGPVRGARR
ncbi:DNA polymerase ligase N-terminal domain-containing protein [Dactylosporangium sp. NPDC051484]|uniref:DNA polymerase ligase N-terminal domain-containing protein n=1 Tax=Dactylosporangium sp. NPDC051484 TaxID=3154942 RepID=UPI00344BC9C6